MNGGQRTAQILRKHPGLHAVLFTGRAPDRSSELHLGVGWQLGGGQDVVLDPRCASPPDVPVNRG